MKKLIVSLLVVAAFVAAPVSLFAQATENAPSSATVITPITLSLENDGLIFGNLSSTSGGTVILTPTSTTGVGTRTGSADLVTDAGVTPQCAHYSVTGDNIAYNILLPADDAVTLTNATTNLGLKTMLLSDFQAYVGSAIGTQGTISGNTSDFTVGATLTAQSGQAAGLYEGSFDVTINYN